MKTAETTVFAFLLLALFLLVASSNGQEIVLMRSLPFMTKDKTKVPYADSVYFAKTMVAQNAMYNHLPEGSPVKEYIRKNCLFLLEPQKGEFTVPLSLKAEDLMNHETAVMLKPGFSAYYTKPSLYADTAGVYLFVHLLKKAIAQCGSCINWTTRLRLHYQTGRKQAKGLEPMRPLYQPCTDPAIGLSAYAWVPVYFVPNYVSDYKNTTGMALSPADTLILTEFTQYHIRVIEQAITVYTKPYCWTGNDIITGGTSWQPGLTIDNSGFSVSWETEDGKVGQAPSIQSASKELGLSMSHLVKVANCIDPYWIQTPRGKVTITIPDKPMKSEIVLAYDKPKNTLSTIRTLKPNLYYLTDKNGKVIEGIGPFNTIGELNVAIGLDKERQNFRWVNKLHLIQRPRLDTFVHIVCNKTTSKEHNRVQVLNVDTNELIVYESMSKMTVAIFGKKRGADKLIHYYVNPGRVYEHNGNKYLISFVHPETAEKAMIKHGAYRRKEKENTET